MGFVSKSYTELLKYNQRKRPMGEILNFESVDGLDVYNGFPFEIDGKEYFVGRVESPNKEDDSKSRFFRENRDGDYILDETAPQFDLQDPFITRVGDEIILGGVKIYPPSKKSKWLEYKTLFYKGNNIKELKLFAEGPDGMKDIRLIELPDENAIGVFTRPEIKIKENGSTRYIKEIGFTKIHSPDELNGSNIKAAESIIKFAKDDFGGVNEAYLLENGEIGVLGHIAYVERRGIAYYSDKKHYYATAFKFNPETYQISDLKIIATRANFPDGQTKELSGRDPNFLKDVIYPTGIRNIGDGTAILYAGLSDKEAGKVEIPYPFEEIF
jgi:hypothetical protein